MKNMWYVAWSMDFQGPLTCTATKKSKMILHLQEAMTKFNIFHATRNKSAKTVIKVLDEVFHEYGFPQVLKTEKWVRVHEYKVASVFEQSRNTVHYDFGI